MSNKDKNAVKMPTVEALEGLIPASVAEASGVQLVRGAVCRTIITSVNCEARIIELAVVS